MERTEKINARKYYISQFEKVKGVYISDGKVWANISRSPEAIMDVGALENFGGILTDILAGILIGLLLKIEKEKIVEVVRNFKVSSHRFETIASKNNIRFIDDSKSTNVHSALNALSSVKAQEEVVLLLGGSDKNLDFKEIFEKYRDKINLVVAFGGARKKILKTASACKFSSIKSCKFFKDAVNLACESAKENSVVLLSPGCASFDEFSSYAERGETFSKIVKRFINAKG